MIEAGDTTPPQTTISSGPSGTVTSTSASFAFTSSEAGSTFECSLDSTTAYTSCSSPKAYAGLAAGSHTFRVRAIDAAGNVDATPASRTWTVQPTPPRRTPRSTSGPTGTVTTDVRELRVHLEREPGSSFQCSLDSGRLRVLQLAAGLLGPRRRAATPSASARSTPPATWTPRPPAGRGPSRRRTPRRPTRRSTPARRAPTAPARPTSPSPPPRRARRFECRLDGGAFAACGATPTFHVAERPAPARGPRGGRRRQRRRDARRDADWWADALLQNGNFETPLAGWTTQGGGYVVPAWKPASGALSLVTGGDAGPQAARVTATAAGSLSVNASPWPINSGAAGHHLHRPRLRPERDARQGRLPPAARVRRLDARGLRPDLRRPRPAPGASSRALQYTVAQSGTRARTCSSTRSARRRRATPSTSTASRSPTARPPRCRPPRRSRATRRCSRPRDVASCWSSGDESVSRLLDTLPGTIAIAGRHRAEPRLPRRVRRAATTRAGAATSRASSRPWATTSTAPPARPATSTTSARPPATAGKGWYSYDLGAWHIVVLNSNCDEIGGCGPGSEQYAVAPAGPARRTPATASAPTGTTRAGAPARRTAR